MNTWKKEDVEHREFLSIEQAAAYSGRSIPSIKQWLRLRKIERYRDEFGYRTMLKREVIDRRIEEIKKYKNRGK